MSRSSAKASTEAYRHYLEGRDYWRKLMWDKARESLLRAVQLDSTFAMAWYQYSRSILSSMPGEQKRAIAHAVLHLDRASSKERLYILAFEAELNREFDQAIGHYKQLVEEYPDEKWAYFEMGFIHHLWLSDYAQAVPWYLKAVEIDPTFKDAYNQLAYCYDNLGDFEKSLWAINKYIELAPAEPNPYDSRGDLYAFNGKLDEAAASYRKALEIDPDFILSIRHLADVYMFRREYTRAESLSQVVAGHPDRTVRAEERTRQTQPLLHQGKFQEALRRLEIGAETDRVELGESIFMVEKIRRRGVIYEWHLKDLDRALAEYEKAKRLCQRVDSNHLVNIYLTGYLARVHARKGNLDSAAALLREFDQLVERIAGSENAWLWGHGHIEMVRGNLDTAAAYFERLLAVETNSIYKLRLADVYNRMGRLGDAVSMFEEALERYDHSRASWPSSAVKLHYDLGTAYEASGWNDKAIEQYETFLDIWKDADPGLESVEDARERLAKLKGQAG